MSAMATTEHDQDVVTDQPTPNEPPSQDEAQLNVALQVLASAVTGPCPDMPPDYSDVHQLQLAPLPTATIAAPSGLRRHKSSPPVHIRRVSPRRTNPQRQFYADLPRIHPQNVWHGGCCYAENVTCCDEEWFRPSKKGPLRALCLVLLDTIIVLLCLLLLTPIILIFTSNCDCVDNCSLLWKFFMRY